MERAADLAAIVNNLEKGDILFIDEIHRLQRPVEERLYSAMEDYEFHIVVGEGMGARTMKLAVNPFTLVGATTRSGLLSSPLRDRFGQHFHLDFYDHDELQQIVSRSARLLKVAVDDGGARELAARSRGTPRIANRLLRRVRDFAQVNEQPVVTPQGALGALDLLEIDAAGFDKMDRAILSAVIDKFGGGPVGVDSLAAAIGEEPDTIEEVYEPYLLQEGFLVRTPRGRAATDRAYKHLGRTRAGSLFGKWQIYVLQHHPVENLGTIADALEEAALAWQYVRIHEGHSVPTEMKGAGGLIVMGGPMGVYQTDRYPFLLEEMRLIEQAVKEDLPVLGVCLGAQIVAAALGAKVAKNPAGKEIGWHPVTMTDTAQDDRLFRGVARTITPFHWHGDVYELPAGAVSLSSSDKTPCQSFRHGSSVYALQFHLEVTKESVASMAAEWPRELEREKIDAAEMIESSDKHLPALESIASTIFSRWAGPIQKTLR